MRVTDGVIRFFKLFHDGDDQCPNTNSNNGEVPVQFINLLVSFWIGHRYLFVTQNVSRREFS